MSKLSILNICIAIGICCYIFINEGVQIEPCEVETKIMRVTAYCPCEKCCGEWADGVTASGYVIVEGDKFCAADMVFGTVLNIPGYGLAVVRDRGGAIKGNRLDVYFDTHQEALEWGVQWLEVRR